MVVQAAAKDRKVSIHWLIMEAIREKIARRPLTPKPEPPKTKVSAPSQRDVPDGWERCEIFESPDALWLAERPLGTIPKIIDPHKPFTVTFTQPPVGLIEEEPE